MSWFHLLMARLKGSFRRSGVAADLGDELRAHREMLAEENRRRGMNPEEAERQAQVTLGNASSIHEAYRDQAGLPFFELLQQDLRYGWRMMRKAPGFALVVILTLAFGIGANSAIFSVVNGVVLKPLPYAHPGELLFVYSSAPARGMLDFGTSPPDFRTLRQGNHTLSSLSASYGTSLNFTGGDHPERLSADVVSSEYFTTLGVKPMLGRAFLPSEEKWGEQRVAVLSEAFWRSRLNADPNLTGRKLVLDGDAYTVVGVMPADFYTPNAVALWLPMAWKPKDNYDSHNNYFLTMVGRMKPGVTPAQASSDLDAIMLSIAGQFPENKGIGARVQLMREAWVGDVRGALMVLLAAVGCVLLIACANVANLMLARSAGRQKEIAIRSALGAARGRLLRQFMTESILLSLLGGASGLVLAWLTLRLLPLASDILPRMQQVRLDRWVLLFTFIVSVLTGVFFGLLPALQSAWARRLNEALKEGGRSSDRSGSGSSRMRTGLVIAEVALALVLLIGSGLALKSFSRLLQVDRGFEADHVLSFAISMPQTYDPDQDPARIGAPPRVIALYQHLLPRLQHLPGVKAVGSTSSLPLTGESWGKLFVPLDRALPASIEQIADIQYRSIAGQYFQALSIPLLKGRYLGDHDVASAPYSIVVNQALARRFWPGQDPIGKTALLTPPESLIPHDQIPPGWHPQVFTVVGVVADVHYGRLDQQAQPTVYGSVFQHDYSLGPRFTMQVEGDPMAQVNAIRAALAEFDASLPIAHIASMNEVVSQSAAQPRLEAILLGLFGLLALIVAGVGIYGVMSYTVAQRINEIGLRMALGASPPAVLRMVIGRGLRLAAIGLGIGLVAGVIMAVATKKMLAGLLFGVSATDPPTFAAIAGLLSVVALLACYVPARRATKVDPLVALRYE